MHNQPFDLGASWQAVLAEELSKPYIAELAAFVANERQTNALPVYPPQDLIFNAFTSTPYDKVKVLVIGQDPYHGPGQAHGLSFSVPPGIPLPPSLKNIYKELRSDLGVIAPSDGCLISWAQQGVMLLNATLTVLQGKPMSHHGRGWEVFTDAVVNALVKRPDPLVFVLWGNSAQKKCRALDSIPHSHLVLKAPHPSPLSAHQGFFGCRHFSKTNKFLAEHGSAPIEWV